jgi:hypothetical protein
MAARAVAFTLRIRLTKCDYKHAAPCRTHSFLFPYMRTASRGHFGMSRSWFEGLLWLCELP